MEELSRIDKTKHFMIICLQWHKIVWTFHEIPVIFRLQMSLPPVDAADSEETAARKFLFK